MSYRFPVLVGLLAVTCVGAGIRPIARSGPGLEPSTSK